MELKQLEARVKYLEELVANLVKWTYYDCEAKSSRNSKKGGYNSNQDQSKQLEEESNVEEVAASFVCPNFDDDDNSMHEDCAIDDGVEANVEVEIGHLEIIKMEEVTGNEMDLAGGIGQEVKSNSTDEDLSNDDGDGDNEVVDDVSITSSDSDFFDQKENSVNKKRHSNHRKTTRSSFPSATSKKRAKKGKSFKDSWNLNRHEMTIHFGEKNFRCERCGQMFSQKVHMTRHVYTVHLGQRFTCAYCRKTFSRKDSMKLHVDSAHLGQKFTCAYCRKTFSRKDSMKFHVDIFHLRKRSRVPKATEIETFRST